AGASLIHPSAEGNIYPRLYEFCRLFINVGQADMVFTIRLDKIIFLCAQRHICHAENSSYQQHRKDNAENRNSIVLAVYLFILRHQSKIAFQRDDTPKSFSTPSLIRNTRSAALAWFLLWVIIKMVC